MCIRDSIQAYAVAVPAAEVELNRRWEAQVHGPFQRNLASKYPFDANARVEAGTAEIAKIFGPEGAIATFANDSLGAMVVRRGDTVDVRTWADLGIRLRPAFMEGYSKWIAPLDGAAGAGGGAQAAAPAQAQHAFQILPQGSPGLLEYTITIDGQVLRYRNTAAGWADFVWPNPAGQPGVRITGITNDGKTVEFLNHAGNFGLERMLTAAKRGKAPAEGVNELTWTQGNVSVVVHLRVVRAPGPAVTPAGGTAPGQGAGLRGLKLPPLVVGVDEPSGNAAAAGAKP